MIGPAAGDLLEAARQQAGYSVAELWIAYFALGGFGTLGEVADVLAGRAPAGRHDHNRLAQALNDRFVDLDMEPSVPYFDELGR